MVVTSVTKQQRRGGAGRTAMRAGMLVVLGAVFWVVLGAPAALGATAQVEDRDGFQFLFYVASAGETNQVAVTRIDEDATIHDSGAAITAGPGCTSINANEVSCTGIDGGVLVRLGDGDDDATAGDGGTVGFGVSVMGGSGGDDLQILNGGLRVLLNGQGGHDALVGDGILLGEGGIDFLTGNPQPAGLNFGDLNGGPGDDTIISGDEGIDIRAGSGDDTIAAGGGNDLITPGPGDDNVDGGPGRNTVFFRTVGAPVVVDLRTGRATGHGDEDTLVSITNVFGTIFADRLIGNGQNNFFFGNGGRDEIRGLGGEDVLDGGECCPGGITPLNDDRIFGGAGNDRLEGGSGGDLLVGGAGSDRLRGEGGDDRIRARDGTEDIVRGGEDQDRASIDGQLDNVEGIEIFL